RLIACLRALADLAVRPVAPAVRRATGCEAAGVIGPRLDRREAHDFDADRRGAAFRLRRRRDRRRSGGHAGEPARGIDSRDRRRVARPGDVGADAPAAERCGLEGAGCSTTPIAVAGGRTFSSLSAGWVLSCALTASGTAYCWGDNASGGLGGGSTASTRTPLAVSGNLTFVTVGTGISFACGLTAAGAVYCWGNNSFGQLGIGATSPERCSAE